MGNINKNPKYLLANPGIIKSKAAKAIAAPEIFHKLEFHFLIN